VGGASLVQASSPEGPWLQSDIGGRPTGEGVRSIPEHSVLLRPQMPELDSVRGIAILMVVFYHALASQFGVGSFTGLPKILISIAAPGWAGVNLFFVLSGFLITGILLDSKPRAKYYQRFYLRRALRILPAYYAVLVLVALLGRYALQEGQAPSWRFLGLSAIYLANVTVLFGVPMQYAVLWSLAVEEHFYFVWPVVVRNFNRHALAVIATAIVAATTVARILTFRAGHYDSYHGYFTWLVADALALGALLAIALRGRLGTRAGLKQIVILLFCGSVALVMDKPLHQHWFGGMLHLNALNLLCAAVVGSVLWVGTGPWKWIVDRPLLRFFGEISYGLYLIHMLIFRVFDNLHRRFFPQIPQYHLNFGVMLGRLAIFGGVAVFVAFVSRRYFEQPFLSLKDRLLAPEPTAAVISIPDGAPESERVPAT
jgi:peptidoglycan/LPS O-acetylase OafA/YrhL